MRTAVVWLMAAFVMPASLAGQSRAKSFEEQKNALKQRGTQLLAAEVARESDEDCSHAGNTAETSQCLRDEGDATNRRYQEYTDVIGALLRLYPPDLTKAERVDAAETRRNFALAESRWLRYRDAECEAVGVLSCTQEVTRRHMKELASLYARLWF
jgi:uncharacterized protein YecT (DUF1311 family)